MKNGQTTVEYLIILATVIIIALIVVGIMGGFGFGDKKVANTCCNATFSGSGAYMPNPASVYCSCRGGDSILKEGTDGQYSTCMLNGTETEEWALFRQDCGNTTG